MNESEMSAMLSFLLHGYQVIGVDAHFEMLEHSVRPLLGKHSGRRSNRSVSRLVDRVDRFGRFVNFADFSIFLHVGELEICLVSKFQLCTTLGDRKNAEKPKCKFFEFFGSVGLVFRSVRSLLRPRVLVDRSGLIGQGQCTLRSSSILY